MFDLQTVKDTYHTYEVDVVKLFKSENIVPVALSEIESLALIKALKTGKLHYPIKQWSNWSKLNEFSVERRGEVSI